MQDRAQKLEGTDACRVLGRGVPNARLHHSELNYLLPLFCLIIKVYGGQTSRILKSIEVNLTVGMA